MKFKVIFKTPDTLDIATEEFGLEEAHERIKRGLVDAEEIASNAAYWQKYAKKFTEKFVRYGELITVEFDMEAGTARVLEV